LVNLNPALNVKAWFEIDNKMSFSLHNFWYIFRSISHEVKKLFQSQNILIQTSKMTDSVLDGGNAAGLGGEVVRSVEDVL